MILQDSIPSPYTLAGITIESAPGAPPLFIPQRLDAGSTGIDFSTNTPALPVVGANFPATGSLFANFVLLTTIPANPARANAEIHNLSGANLIVIRDDGTAQAGTPMTNASLFGLPAGPAQGISGKPYVNRTFKGRYQIYGPAGAGPITALAD